MHKDDAIYAAVPQKYKTAGVINAATEADYPPFDFLDDNNKLIGADLDISKALGIIMGVPVENHKTDFSEIIPGIQAGRFDIGVSSIGDYPSRRKVADFVDYYRGGTSFLVKTGGFDPKTQADLCGTSVGVLAGTSSLTQAQDSSKLCVSKGKAPITVNAYPTQNDAVGALTSGRVQSVSGDSATNGYSAKQVGAAISNVGFTVYGDQPLYGIAVPVNSALYQPLFDAMGVLMKSGVYGQILHKWGIEGGAIPAPLKNQGTN